ncbi:MAG: SDR family NAD(P)-dependent oxidoreductase [Chloroflexota bacterium]
MPRKFPSPSTQKLVWLGLGLSAGIAGAACARRRQAARAAAWHSQMAAQAQRTALVTGASSGIGEAYAQALAARGYNLVLVARRTERLHKLAGDLNTRYRVQVEVLSADLSSEAGIANVEGRIEQKGDIAFLVNNAGYDVFGPFAEIPAEEAIGLINCHLLASVRFTRAALPGMLTRRHGAVVNVSSIGAFTPKPQDSTYVSAKAYLNMFSESLAIELKGTGVRLQALCPGFTLTEFHDAPQYAQYHIKERVPAWLWMSSAAVVQASLGGIEQEQVICVPGLINQAIVASARSGLSNFLLRILRALLYKPKRIAPELPNQNIYRLYAPVYDAVFRGLSARPRQHAIRLLELQPGERLLIPGVGTGLDLPLIPAGVKITAGDISANMLAQARKKTGGLEIELALMDAQRLEYPAESFDAVLFNLVLSVVPDGRAAFQEAWRVLRPGGRVAIFDKFLPAGHEVNAPRRLLGQVIRAVGTDPNRRLSDILADTPGLEIVQDEPSLLRGQYRLVLLRKSSA